MRTQRVDLNVVINDRQSDLMIEADAILAQVDIEDTRRGAFTATRAHRRVHFHRCAQNLPVISSCNI